MRPFLFLSVLSVMMITVSAGFAQSTTTTGSTTVTDPSGNTTTTTTNNTTTTTGAPAIVPATDSDLYSSWRQMNRQQREDAINRQNVQREQRIQALENMTPAEREAQRAQLNARWGSLPESQQNELSDLYRSRNNAENRAAGNNASNNGNNNGGYGGNWRDDASATHPNYRNGNGNGGRDWSNHNDWNDAGDYTNRNRRASGTRYNQ